LKNNNKIKGAWFKLPLLFYLNFDLSRTMLAQTDRLFCPLFQKWRPARSRAARLERIQRFFSIAFLCAYFVKEKRLKSLGI
jgi:hypothetical protein